MLHFKIIGGQPKTPRSGKIKIEATADWLIKYQFHRCSNDICFQLQMSDFELAEVPFDFTLIII